MAAPTQGGAHSEREWWGVAERLAADPASSPDVLRRLAHDLDSSVRLTALRNPNMPGAELENALRTGEMQVCLAVVWNPSTPANLVNDVAESVMTMIDDNGRAWSDSRRKLAALLSHEGITPDNLRRALSADEGSTERPWVEAIALNANLPASLALSMLRTEAPEARLMVIRNEGVPAAALASHDWGSERDVSALATAAVRLAGTPLEQRIIERLMMLDTGTPREPWQALIRQENMAVAARGTMNPVHVTQLCGDSSKSVREAALSNPLATETDQIIAALVSS